MVKIEQCFVDFVNIVVSVDDVVFDDPVKGAGMGQRVAGSSNQVLGFLQTQFQCDGKGNGSGLGRIVVGIVADLGKQLSVDICPLIDFRVLFPSSVDIL